MSPKNLTIIVLRHVYVAVYEISSRDVKRHSIYLGAWDLLKIRKFLSDEKTRGYQRTLMPYVLFHKFGRDNFPL